MVQTGVFLFIYEGRMAMDPEDEILLKVYPE